MPDIEEVRQQIGHLDGAEKLLGRKEIKVLPGLLWEDEVVEKLVQGLYNNSQGVLIATNKRLVFVDKGLVKLRVEDFPYDKMSSIQYELGVVFGKITIYTSGHRGEIRQVQKQRAADFCDYVRARITSSTPHAGAAQSSVPSSQDSLEHLDKLAKLHEQGSLTDEEFSQAKKRLLSE